ncbi:MULTISPECIES: alpha/beta fold hydrolase [unclassified Luteococcus]|uniref:alpha/beta fold hydrolase n=1 Tax=unclassified Luteococcus TaxID=2639923 RepID=UPI00313CC048
MLQVSHGHQVYWESSGNPSGIPVLYLHGGPGGVLRDGYRRKFNPDVYRIIGLQQRGAGRSTPHAASPEHDPQTNTTTHLLADIEALRTHLGIDRWLVCGVSWGCTLALHHALAQPEHVLGLVLVAVTTTSPAEVAWITEGVQTLYPEAWDRLAGLLEERTDWRRGSRPLIDALAEQLTGAGQELRAELAVAWMAWEDSHIQIGLPAEQLRPVGLCEQPIAEQIALTSLVSHYWTHHAALDPAWVPEGGLQGRLGELAGLPICMIHGRRDVSGPVSIPWAVKGALPGAELHIVESEGHGGEQMMELWCRATDSWAARQDFTLV